MAGIKDKHRFIFMKYVPPKGKAAQESSNQGGLGDSPMKLDTMPDGYEDVAAENPPVNVPEQEGAAELVNAGGSTGTNCQEMTAYPEQPDYPVSLERPEEPEEAEYPEEPEVPVELEVPEVPVELEVPEVPEVPEELEELEEPEGPCPENAIVHVIQEGDTFWKLAKKYGTTVEAISDANPDVDPLNLQVGETLCIPVELPGAKG